MNATKTPIRIVDLYGVVGRSDGRHRKSSAGTIPSRAIARNTRGPDNINTSSTDVIPATPGGRNDELRPRQAGLFERIDTPGIHADPVVTYHSGQHGNNCDVQQRAQQAVRR